MPATKAKARLSMNGVMNGNNTKKQFDEVINNLEQKKVRLHVRV